MSNNSSESDNPNKYFVEPTITSGEGASVDVLNLGIKDLFEMLREDSPFRTHMGLNIPDTICYNNFDGPSWYFTSVKNGLVLRKNQYNTTSDKIFDSFKRPLNNKKKKMYTMSHEQANSKMDEIRERRKERRNARKQSKAKPKYADHKLQIFSEPQPIKATYVRQQNSLSGKSRTEVDYLDEDELSKLLFDKRKKSRVNGILQKFVKPQTEYNATILVTWTPSLCVIENRMNKNRMYDASVPIKERISTMNNKNIALGKPLPDHLQTQLKRLCSSLIKHIEHITQGVHSVRKLIATFKVDNLGKIWFLYFNGLRTSTEDFVTPAKWINYTLNNEETDDDEAITTQKPTKPTKKTNGKQNNEHNTTKKSQQTSSKQMEQPLSPQEFDADTIIEPSELEHSTTSVQVGEKSPEKPKKKSSSKKRRASSQLENSTFEYQPPERVRSGTTPAFNNNIDCLDCNRRYDRIYALDVSYRTIIKFCEKELSQKFAKPIAQLNDKITIPSLIEKCNPDLKLSTYKKLRHNPLWNVKLVKICDLCGSKYMESLIETFDLEELVDKPPPSPKPAVKRGENGTLMFQKLPNRIEKLSKPRKSVVSKTQNSSSPKPWGTGEQSNILSKTQPVKKKKKKSKKSAVKHKTTKPTEQPQPTKKASRSKSVNKSQYVVGTNAPAYRARIAASPYGQQLRDTTQQLLAKTAFKSKKDRELSNQWRNLQRTNPEPSKPSKNTQQPIQDSVKERTQKLKVLNKNRQAYLATFLDSRMELQSGGEAIFEDESDGEEPNESAPQQDTSVNEKEQEDEEDNFDMKEDDFDLPDDFELENEGPSSPNDPLSVNK
mmetsp:Transcript_11243/g.16627  ORF Transcript_11243/g.16627 Transcript_11243/m.16627 type:complete len:831 (+) Transcript_11243:68-2560(+)